jgi:hypothetical protein
MNQALYAHFNNKIKMKKKIKIIKMKKMKKKKKEYVHKHGCRKTSM